jgi:thiol-disulfide isomerase/thioredoxin
MLYMKRSVCMLIMLSLLLLCGAVSPAVAQGIQFEHGKWEEVKALAKKENKLIFVDFYTDWCAPCKVMATTIFPQKEVGDFFNKNFISVQIDAEKGEGPGLAKKYNVAGYPTLAFTNAGEEVVYKVLGSADAKEFIDQATIALTPSSDYPVLKEKYEKDELSREDLYRYLLLVKAKGDDKAAGDVFDKYFALNTLVSADMYKMITSYNHSSKTPAFAYLEQHRADFAAVAGKEKVEEYIHEFLIREYEYKTYADEAAYRAAIGELKGRIELSEKEALNIDANHYWGMLDETNYLKYAGVLVKKYYWNDDHELSNVLGSVRFVKDEGNLKMMLPWAKRAVALKDNSLNNITLAMLYNKLQDKKMALKYADASLAASKRDGDGYEVRIIPMRKEIEEAKY